MYRDGKGTEKDLVRAYMFLNLAAAPEPLRPDGFLEVAQERDEVAKHLTPEQVAEGQRRSWEWQPGEIV
jgi:hypothetical protein